MAYEGFFNETPIAAEPLLLADEHGRAMLTVVAKATYVIAGTTALRLAGEQLPVRHEPVYWGEPGASSLRYESDAVFDKPATDVALLGHARPERVQATHVDVALRVGPVDKRARVFGDRRWKTTLGIPSIAAPQPFEAIPLVYERSFGGWDRTSKDPADHACHPLNPVGCGYVRSWMKRPIDGVPLPNIEDLENLIGSPGDHPRPIGFGLLAASWSPRRELAGTYDEAWRRDRFPLVPADFDRRHLCAAPVDQQVPKLLRGGERVEVVGASTRGVLRFDLPRVSLAMVARVRGRDEEVPLRLDTLLVDADEHRVELVFRASLPVHRRTHDIGRVALRLVAGSLDR